MSNMVTRCPQCHTSFKVTDEHLKIANGAVRCGSCLHVFQARQHWMNPANIPPSAAASSFGKLNFDQSMIDNESADDFLRDADPLLSDKDLDQPAKKNPMSQTVRSGQPARKLQDIGNDDRISDDMELDDEEETAPMATIISAPAADDTHVRMPAALEAVIQGSEGDIDDYTSLFEDAPAAEDQESAAFEDLLEGAFDEAGGEYANAVDESGLAAVDETDWSAEYPEYQADQAWSDETPVTAEELPVEELPYDELPVAEVVETAADAPAPRRAPPVRDPFEAREVGQNKAVFGEDRSALIAHIEPPPVIFQDYRKQAKTPVKMLVLQVVAIILLAFTLWGQYVYFHFTELARDESHRGSMEKLCKLAGCQLPPLESWRNIRISSLVVRKHPEVDNALVIDAILLNTSEYPRPFPRIEMYFNEEDKLPFASRRFEPAEYLSGEMQGKTEIPPGQPVHIALEIVNPGPKAVNWSMRVSRLPD